MSFTHHESELNLEAKKHILFVSQLAPEMALEALAELYSNRDSVLCQLAAAYLAAGVLRICKESPEYCHQKELSGKTIGEIAARRIRENPNRDVAEIIDVTIADAVSDAMVKKWKEKS